MDAYLMPSRPPLIRFETRAEKRYATADKGGTLFFVDVDYALVTPHGSKETVEKALPEWFVHLDSEVRQGRLDPNWLKSYRESHKLWKAGEELPVNGTAIKNWPVLSPAEAKMLTEGGIRAVEDLAVANEESLARVGMGARGLKQKAVDWVKSQKDTSPLVHEMAATRAENEGLKYRIEQLEQMVAGLGRQAQSQPAGQQQEYIPRPPEEQLAELRAGRDEGPSEDSLIEDGLNS